MPLVAIISRHCATCKEYLNKAKRTHIIHHPSNQTPQGQPRWPNWSKGQLVKCYPVHQECRYLIVRGYFILKLLFIEALLRTLLWVWWGRNPVVKDMARCVFCRRDVLPSCSHPRSLENNEIVCKSLNNKKGLTGLSFRHPSRPIVSSVSHVLWLGIPHIL